MRAELMVLGKSVDLSLRFHRRVLVACVYATLLLTVILIAWCSGFNGGWRLGGVYLVFFALFLNRFLLGGYARGGLIRTFSNEPPPATTPSPFILLKLQMRLSDLSDGDWHNDERELQLRDRVHYQAYQVIGALLTLI